MTQTRPLLDPLTQATVTIAWVIVFNKPFYPVYVWYLVGNGVAASCATLLAAPLFLAIPFIARQSPFMARLALPIVGTLDTLFETKLFGHGSGTALFFGACFMLSALSFFAQEKWWQRSMAAFVFAVFLFSQYLLGPPLRVWSDPDLAILLRLNMFSVACLMAFIAIRYAGLETRRERH
ncbi:hypothetical protein [Neorhizobium sp. DAR64861/K0K2]|uniref:hypothetical protein n=1 Tax=unclassified Neorhizobium TaxID=2629175 RepID=UPI003D26A448